MGSSGVRHSMTWNIRSLAMSDLSASQRSEQHLRLADHTAKATSRRGGEAWRCGRKADQVRSRSQTFCRKNPAS